MEITTIKKADALEALNRSEIDVQIATAKQYPRDINRCINQVRTLSTINEEIAGECFYHLERKGSGDGKVIEGPSVRFAEMVASSYGNLRVQAQIIANDGKFITARGICHDLETNFASAVEVQRRITDKNGRTYNDDMQVVTGNAACAIAFRNAVFKVVPMALFNPIMDEVKKVIKGDAENLPMKRQEMINYFATLGVSKEMILFYLNVESVEDITSDMIVTMRGVLNALRGGDTTVEESFVKPYKEKEAAKKAKEKGASVKDKVAASLAKQNGGVEAAAENEPEEQSDDLPM